MNPYLRLMRFDRPIGIWLLLWPTLWALWLASGGVPAFHLLMIFISGTIIMRAAGCIINDIADRNIDPLVKRTCNRPLATKEISVKKAVILLIILASVALWLVWQLNPLTRLLSIVGCLLTLIYPFMKRIIPTPQFVLGIAFSWSVPMAYAAILNNIPHTAWLVFAAAALWNIIYDTCYAMSDRAEDLKIGIYSFAIFLGKSDRLIIGLLQLILLTLLYQIGTQYQLHHIYFITIIMTAGLMIYHQYLIRNRATTDCFQAFLHNRWIGLCIWVGIVLSHYIRF